MKKFIIFVFMLVSIFLLSSCKKSNENEIDYEKVDEVMQYIDLLPNKITLKNEEEVNNCITLYNSLNDNEKALVENYDTLSFAQGKITYLKEEDKYILAEYENVSANLKTLIPDEIESDEYTLEFIKQYNAKNDYASYLMYLTWITSDPNTISTQTGKVNHANVDVTVTITCTISCTNISDTYEFSKDVLVKKTNFESFGKQVVTAYFYGDYTSFTELDYKTLDMVIYCFSDILSRETESGTEYYVDGDTSDLTKITEVRSKGIRVLFSLGGWHDDSAYWETYQKCASSEESRKQIANSILEYCIKYHLDGVDMDWEYPRNSDRNNYTLLMKEIYTTLKAADPNYIISCAIPCGSTWVGERYNFSTLNDWVDFVNMMSYDLDGDSVTSNHTDYAHMLTGLNYFTSQGISASKIVCGAAFYGRIFYDVNNKNNGLGQKYSSKEEISFYNINKNYLSRLDNGVTKYIDFTNKAYYLYDSENSVFISYDDPKAIQQKCMYSYENGYAGIMFWTYTQDPEQILMQAIYDYYHSVDIK